MNIIGIILIAVFALNIIVNVLNIRSNKKAKQAMKEFTNGEK